MKLHSCADFREGTEQPSGRCRFVQEQQLLHSSSHLFQCLGAWCDRRRSHRLDARLGGGRGPSSIGTRYRFSIWPVLITFGTGRRRRNTTTLPPPNRAIYPNETRKARDTIPLALVPPPTSRSPTGTSLALRYSLWAAVAAVDPILRYATLHTPL